MAQVEKIVIDTIDLIILKIKPADKHEFVTVFRDAVSEIFLLLFECCEFDLGEEQLYSLY